MSFEQIADALTLHNIPLILSCFITFPIGILQYVYSFKLVLRDRRSPFPVSMNTLNFAVDSTWTVRCFISALCNERYWFLIGLSAFSALWTLASAALLYMAITIEGEDNWAQTKTTTRKKVSGVVLEIIAFLGIVNVLVTFMGEECLLQQWYLAAAVMTWGPSKLGETRRSREGCSIIFALLNVLQNIMLVLPTGIFVLIMPEVFNTAWFYLAGAALTCVSIGNLVVVLELPMKKDMK